jgi:hypothetical protein
MNQCVGICTGGATLLIGSIKCLVKSVKEKNHNVIMIHCFFHREVHASKIIGEILKQVLDVDLSMVNFKKQLHLKLRIFAKLCESMQKDNVTLFNTQKEMAVKREVISRVFLLREITAFYQR